MTEAWERVRQVFAGAFELDGDARGDYLDRACGEDRELRAEVEQLLEQAQAPGEFLEPPRVEREGDAETADGWIGRRIGAYEILCVLGAGGMGTVFAARQEQPRRQVALKVMSLGFASAETAHRFRFEADVLGRLRHPGIAQVYEAGVHTESRELPWFAMEFVEDAQPIVAHARQSAMSLEDRLRLFVEVCEAVHYGHQRGVIHRDLKPDNILVDAQGRTKVIDFGVARAVDHDGAEATRYTRAGTILGTLHYMSPEHFAQGGEEVDARSDVYGLGIVLYELLCERFPYDVEGVGVHEVARVICEEPPRRPGSARRELAGDLEVIALAALEKEPARRYASAAALAADIRRYLAHEPIEARAPSMTYQLRMFARRNRALVGAVIAVVVVSAVAAVLALREASAARDAEAKERSARGQATRLFGNLLDLSTSSVFEFAQRLRNVEGTTQVQVDMLQKAVDNLEHLHGIDPGDDAIRRHLAEALVKLAIACGGYASQNVGESERAEAASRRAEVVLAPLLEGRPAEDLRYLALRARMTVAELAYARLDQKRARPLLEDCLRDLEALSAERPDDAVYALNVAALRENLGVLAGVGGDDEEALNWFERAQVVREQVIAQNPDDPHRQHALAIGYGKIGAALKRLKRSDEAVEAHGRALAAAEAAHRAAPDHALYRAALAGDHLGLANALAGPGSGAEAEEHFRTGLGMLADMIATDPENVRLRQTRAIGAFQFGRLFQKRAERDGDEAPWREARTWFGSSQAELAELRKSDQVPRYLEPLVKDVERGLRACAAALGDG